MAIIISFDNKGGIPNIHKRENVSNKNILHIIDFE